MYLGNKLGLVVFRKVCATGGRYIRTQLVNPIRLTSLTVRAKMAA
ncbi:hypothetical protein ABIB38_002540 [Massilia sp. UYP11]